jgi:hypothetical protein
MLEDQLGHLARLDQLPRARLERVAKAAVGGGGDRARLAVGVPARDQRRGDLFSRQRTEAQLRAARSHRRQQYLRSGCNEDEDRGWRRLVERLQQRMLRGLAMITTRRRPSNGRYGA